MKRLLNQIPVKIKGTNKSNHDFNAKMSNLYLLLRKRVSMKEVFEVSMNVNMKTATDEIDIITERILSLIMDYDDYCATKEEEMAHKNEMPARILNLF